MLAQAVAVAPDGDQVTVVHEAIDERCRHDFIAEDLAPLFKAFVGRQHGRAVRIITETGLRVYKELTPMKKEQLDLVNRLVWIPDSKTANGIAEVPLTDVAATAFADQTNIAGDGLFLFPSDTNPSGHQTTFKTAWAATLRRAKVPYFRIYDLRSTYATRLSAGGVADEWVTQLLRQGDAKVFKKYSQMKLQMKREALQKINRLASEGILGQAG